MKANTITSIGLVLDIIRVILLFYYGIPSQIPESENELVWEEKTE